MAVACMVSPTRRLIIYRSVGSPWRHVQGRRENGVRSMGILHYIDLSTSRRDNWGRCWSSENIFIRGIISKMWIVGFLWSFACTIRLSSFMRCLRVGGWGGTPPSFLGSTGLPRHELSLALEVGHERGFFYFVMRFWFEKKRKLFCFWD